MTSAALALSVFLAATPAGPDAGVRGSRAALDATLDRAYPNLTDWRYGLEAKPGEPAPPLAEVVAYRVPSPTPHWLYVTYGLSELEGKVSEDSKLSGFGVEYTLRLVDSSEKPPAWPIHLLRQLAATTRETHAPYWPGHSMNFAGPTLEKVSPGVEGLAFYEDDVLKTITTPSGSVTFSNAVPLFAGEFDLVGSWDAFKFAGELRAAQRDLLWRKRPSVLKGPRADAIDLAVQKDGSSQAMDYAELEFGPKEVLLGSVGVRIFDKFLRHRLTQMRDARVVGPTKVLTLSPASWSYACGAKGCELKVPQLKATPLADEIAQAKDGAVITRPGGIRLRVDRTK